MTKVIFAKATATHFCAIVAYQKDGKLRICDSVESENIQDFLKGIIALARAHNPEMVQYECSVYLHECRELRESLYEDDIIVRGYKSEGQYLDRIISQVDWIKKNVVIKKETQLADKIMAFSPTDESKDNITLDVLSDATKFLRRYYENE